MSNPGTSDVTGVEISVAGNEQVTPASSQSSFFVGNLSSSDFTNFQVNAGLRTQTNQTVTIPVKVSYVVDGVRQERVIGVDYTPGAGPGPGDREQPRQRGGGGGFPLELLVGVVLVGGLGLFGWRRYRG